MRNKRMWILIGYGLFAWVMFGLFLYFTFPIHVLTQRAMYEVMKHSHGSVRVSFKDASMYRFTGVKLSDVTLHQDRPGQEPLDLEVDSIAARLQVLPLLRLKMAASLALELGRGVVHGEFLRVGPHAWQAGLEVEKVSLLSPPILSQWAGFPVRGTVTGTIDLDMPDALNKAKGQASLILSEAGIGPGSVSGFTVPSIALGNLDMNVELREGTMRIMSFKQEGGDLNTRLQGLSRLQEPLSASVLDACLQLRAEEALLTRNPTIKAALELAALRLQKDEDGFLHIPFFGTLASPHLRQGMCRR